MNQSQYERLKSAFTTYNTWRVAGFVAGDNQSQSHLMTMLSVHVEIFSTMPPPDLSCPSCVQDMMKRLYEQTNYTIYDYDRESLNPYWQEVKQEIDKL